MRIGVLGSGNVGKTPARGFVSRGHDQGKPTMFMAGDDPDATATLGEVLTALGWDDVIDIGGIEGAR